MLTLSTSATTSMPVPADLGFLLHKHPDRAQSFDVASGTVHVIWPEVSDERATVAVLLEVDPVALVRGRGGRGDTGFSLSQYVNDRPYAASSMLSVALGKVFRTAMSGRCDARPELAGRAIPLEVHVPALPTRGGADLVERLFAPLGWSVTTTAIVLDEQVPSWGVSPYVDLRLAGVLTVADALTQLYVLMPVLDDTKHYWVNTDEVDKLMRAGGHWLADHPERELITSRYLGHHHTLVQDAVGRLAELDETEAEVLDEGSDPGAPERPASMAQLRKAAVVAALRSEGATTVVDLGCGEGALLRALVADPAFTRVTGVDVSHRALEIATRRLHPDRMPDSQRARLELLQSSATYRDDRLAGYDAVVLMEVVEHVDLPRLPALERSVFAHARPTSVLVTTPNVEHNVRFPNLRAGEMRHRDHRFEWTRQEFQTWAGTTATAYGYTVRFEPVGEDDPEVGPPTQLAVFRKVAA
nr:3' terminal RNA ribose 2'-O-methyltransferase Hen1 [Microlunatus antarcticus]